MLIVKVFVNDRQIDEIAVQNVSEVYSKTEYQSYKIRKPKGKGECLFIHKASEGYRKLLYKVLEFLIEKEK